jgi:predicted permease
MESSVVINQVIILFFVIIVGVYARKRNIISADMTKKMSDLLLQVTQPLLIISSFQFEFSEEMLRNAALVLLMSLVIHLFSMLVARFIYIRYPERTRSVLKYITVFSNCGFMGFPVLESVFGSVGVFYGALYVIPFNVLALSYGVMVFTGKSDKDTIKKILSHPVIISVAVGMVLFLLQIQLPGPVAKAVSMVGSMTSPLSMLIVGALLAEIPFREMFSGIEVYVGSAVRLILLPLLLFGILSLLRLPEDVLRVCTILTAMPAAANTAIFAEKYDGAAGLASRLIGISTILSIFTIPLILLLL